MVNPSHVLVIYLLVMIEKDVSANDQCCTMLSVSLTGSAKQRQASRLGKYQLLTSTKYQQIGGKTILYKWKDKNWYFGVDTHTSGIQSEQTQECPSRIDRWRFWIKDEEWSDFLTDEISVTCLNQNPGGLSENMAMGQWSEDMAMGQDDNLFLYTEEDGPNVDCLKLKETDPDAIYPPHPQVVLLGESGVGKTSLMKQLLGCYRKDKNCEQFNMVHGQIPNTTETIWAVGNYLGKGGCLTILETPKVSESEDWNYNNTLQIKNEFKSVDVFLLMFPGTDTIISNTMKKILKIYENIFTNNFWKNSITEITYWKWDGYSVEERIDEQDMDASKKHQDWRALYKDEFGVTIKIPTLFIDPVFQIFDKTPRGRKKVRKQPEAVEKFMFYTSLLWKFANKSGSIDHYYGAPWVKPIVIQGQMDTKQTATCKIWKFGSQSTENVIWKFNDIVIFEKKQYREEETYTHSEWADKINVTEIETDRSLELHLTLLELNLETQGVYTCENDQESENNQVDMKLIINDQESEHNPVEMKQIINNCHLYKWNGWSTWSGCDPNCGVGIRNRSRSLLSPTQLGGINCGEVEQSKLCFLKVCPSCGSFMSPWTEWTPCSYGLTIQQRTQSINLAPQMTEFTGMDCSGIEDKVETRECPVDCLWGKWSKWTNYACSRTCDNGTRQQTRWRTIEQYPKGSGKVCSGPSYVTNVVQCDVGLTLNSLCPSVSSNYVASASSSQVHDDVKIEVLNLIEEKTKDLRKETDALRKETQELRDETQDLREETKGLKEETKELRVETTDLNDEVAHLKELSKLQVIRSCEEMAQYGVNLSDFYLIDPDGPLTGQDPIRVFCSFTKGGAVTELSHNLEQKTEVEHCHDPGCYSRQVVYEAHQDQIQAVIELSEHCEQTIRYDCMLAPLMSEGVNFAFWSDKHGQDQIYWDGDHSGEHVCACHYSEQECLKEETLSTVCNCDAQIPQPMFDEGKITNMSALPITGVKFGGLSYDLQQGFHTLGKLKCQGRAKASEVNSCSALKLDGTFKNGFYNVKDTGNSKLVFCNMTTPGYFDQNIEVFIESSEDHFDEVEADIRTMEADIGTIEAAIGTNKADIGTNKADIGTIEADIGTNKADIGTNKADIGTNKADIGTNKAELPNLPGKWSAGSYCILASGNCPVGFTKHYGKLDLIDANSHPRYITEAHFGDSYIEKTHRSPHTGRIKIVACCK